MHWLRSNTVHKKPYVRQWVANIRDLCPNAEFRRVAGTQNPADLVTRGLSVREFLKFKQFWLNGPNFLHQKTFETMENKCFSACISGICEESLTGISPLTMSVDTADQSKNFHLINLERFNDYSRVLRVTAYVLRFVYILKCKAKRI